MQSSRRIFLATVLVRAAIAVAAAPASASTGSDTAIATIAESTAAEPSPAGPAVSVGFSDIEFIGPFANWLDVQSSLGAKGDGVADDTAAIQKGLDALYRYDSASGPATLYFPAGRYRITRTLHMRLHAGANLVGAGASSTVLFWDGDPGGTMLLSSGAFDTLFTRLTWDGKGRARIGIAQWWNFSLERANYQGSIKHIDEIFQDLGIGISGGRLGADYGQGDSETLIQRVQFIRNSIAGVNVGSFNALNWWIWDSRFVDCARGLSNGWSIDDKGETGGAGTFSVYRSQFLRSTVADAFVGNTGWFAFYGNVSIGSRQFIRALPNGANGGPILAQNNRVIDTLEPDAIRVGNEGPLILLDNRFRSRGTAQSPAVLMETSGDVGDRDVVSLGNAFTVSPAIGLLHTRGRILSSDTVVDAGRIAATMPNFPAPAPDFHRAVFEVKPGATGDQIQAVIDAAIASGSENAVVHLPAGNYRLDRTLVVAANARVQIAGDSESTKLWWAGHAPDGTMVRLEGPSYATLRDLCLVGARTTAIAVGNADQPGGRIFIEGSRLSVIDVQGLSQTRLDAQANSGIAALRADSSASLLAVGGFGPVRMRGNSTVVETDNWYEGDEARLLDADDGSFTYLGGEMAPYSHGVRRGLLPDTPAVLLDGFRGRASVIGATLDLKRASNGIVLRSPAPGSYALFLGITGTAPGFFVHPQVDAPYAGVINKLYSRDGGARGIADAGKGDLDFVMRGFDAVRAITWETTPFSHTPGATDVRLFRIFDADTGTGLLVQR